MGFDPGFPPHDARPLRATAIRIRDEDCRRRFRTASDRANGARVPDTSLSGHFVAFWLALASYPQAAGHFRER
jgi:hypothetical protein